MPLPASAVVLLPSPAVCLCVDWTVNATAAAAALLMPPASWQLPQPLTFWMAVPDAEAFTTLVHEKPVLVAGADGLGAGVVVVVALLSARMVASFFAAPGAFAA